MSAPSPADRSLKIAMVCPYSLAVPGGVQNQVLTLAHVMRERGHEVLVIAPTDGVAPVPGVVSIGWSLPAETNGSVAPLAPDPAAQIRTIAAIERERFDVIHIHEPLAPGPSATALLLHGAPTVATFHASGDFSQYRVFRRICTWGSSFLDVIVAVSEDAANTANGWIDKPCEVLFNGVDTDRFATVVPHRQPGRTVLFIGRHEDRKGLDVALAAVEHLPSDVHLDVIGQGPLTEELQQRYRHEPRIRWLGRVGDDERDRRLKGADVFCAPARGGESFGIVLLDAMAAETPVVATRIDGYTNVATDEVNALLCPPDDPPALAAAIMRMLEDSDLREHCVSNGLERASEFAMERLAGLYLDRYERAIATGKTVRPRLRARRRSAVAPRQSSSMM